ncbi:MAG: PAS domain S-box protein, partial [Ferruginibacter sp.]
EEVRAKSITGDYLWFQSKTSPVYDLEGKLIGIRVLAEDINDRKRAETVLRESEEKFRSIVEQSLVGIYIIQNGKLIYVNPGFEKIFGYSKNKLINKMSFDGLVHEDDLELVTNNYNKRIGKRKAKEQYIFRAIKSDGTILHVEVIASVILYNDEPAIIGTLVDISNRIEEEKRINRAVLDAQEKERYQIGMELHDNVKQILAASGLYLGMAQKKIDDKEAVTEILNDLTGYNAEAIDELRRLSHQLAPLVESDTILDDKIAWLIRSLKMDEKLSVSVHIDEFKKAPDNDTQLAFYRILQEQLSNILKYAAASLVEINIRSAARHILLQIRDNGKGFDSKKKKEGIGLENIRRRAEMMGGKVEIITAQGKGCEINVLVPLTHGKSKRQQ